MYRSELRRRRRVSALALATSAVAVALTVRASPVMVTAPAASPADLLACTAVVARLPSSLDRERTRPVTPPSPITAAWGRPPITLACGAGAVAHPVSDGQVCLGGQQGTCNGALVWYRDVLDPTLWSTRRAPRLSVRVPASDGFADVLGPITAAAQGR